MVLRLSGSQKSQAHLPQRPDSQMSFSARLLPTHPGGGFQKFLEIMISLFPWWGIRVGVSVGIREGEPPSLNAPVSCPLPHLDNQKEV